MGTLEIVFISWSGETSRKVAESLRTWMPLVYEGPRLWLSSKDIPNGTRWLSELSSTLEKTNFGVLVVTQENLNSPWLHFEAGALSKNLTTGTVIPYLIDLSPENVSGPLSQFQAVSANREGTLRLMRSLCEVSGNCATDVLIRRFDMFWPELEKNIASILQSENKEEKETEPDQATSALNEQIADMTKMLRQLVTALHHSSDIKQSATSNSELSFLEGSWIVETNGTHMYAKVIDGYLVAPYCYGGNDRLTSAYYDWQKEGAFWFSRFEWLIDEIKGFGFYRLESNDILDGWWWYDDGTDPNVIPNMPTPASGSHIRLIRAQTNRVPQWAQDFFDRVARYGYKETSLKLASLSL